MKCGTMRKLIVLISCIYLLFLTTCKTDNVRALSSGSWTFKNVTHSNTKGLPGIWHGAVVSVVAENNSSGNPSLVVSDNGTNPFVSGTFPLGMGAGAIGIEVLDSSGGAFIPASDDTTTVSVQANGSSISLAASGVKMVNFGLGPYDTSILTFNITQTY